MAGVRDYNFLNGPETPSLPASTTPSADSDFMTKGYADTHYGINISGTKSVPISIVAGSGVTATANNFQTIFIKGNGGAVDISANPQISAGTVLGQVLKLVGCDNTNTVLFEDGTGLSLNGPHTMGLNDTLTLFWDGTTWIEEARREN